MNITLTMDERNKDTGHSKNTHGDSRLIGGTLSVKSGSVTQAGTVCSIFRTGQQWWNVPKWKTDEWTVFRFSVSEWNSVSKETIVAFAVWLIICKSGCWPIVKAVLDSSRWPQNILSGYWTQWIMFIHRITELIFLEWNGTHGLMECNSVGCAGKSRKSLWSDYTSNTLTHYSFHLVPFCRYGVLYQIIIV